MNPVAFTPEELQQLKASFKYVESNSKQAADIFYGHLFDIAPDLKPLFAHTDMRDQRQKFFSALRVMIGSIQQPHLLDPAMTQLGKRHAKYGVRPEMFQKVGGALMMTLEEVLGELWTAEVEEAWIRTYTYLADIAAATLAPEGH